jgi:hypothetical protein
VLLRGSIEFNDEHRVRLWSGDAFAATDLVAYLDGSTTHADFAGAMVEVDVETPIGDRCLIFPTVGLDLVKLKATILGRYPSVPQPARE